jgi:hypothetical protein
MTLDVPTLFFDTFGNYRAIYGPLAGTNLVLLNVNKGTWEHSNMFLKANFFKINLI